MPMNGYRSLEQRDSLVNEPPDALGRQPPGIGPAPRRAPRPGLPPRPPWAVPRRRGENPTRPSKVGGKVGSGPGPVGHDANQAGVMVDSTRRPGAAGPLAVRLPEGTRS